MSEQTRKKLDMVAEQFGSLQHPDPPMRIDWMFSVAWMLLVEWEPGDRALVYLPHNGEIGIVDRDVAGYTPTPAYVYPETDGHAAVIWFNENILGLSQLEANKIVLSSMGARS